MPTWSSKARLVAMSGLAAAVLATGAAPSAGSAPGTAAVPPGVTVLDRFVQPVPGTGDEPPAPVATYAGWIAWSRRDDLTGAYELILRDPAGQTAAAGVRPRAQPFDVNLGPTPSGGVAAVYSRCQTAATSTGCRIVELVLGEAAPAEQTVHPPGGGSLHSPALWGTRLAFLRVHPGGGAAHPDDLFEWTAGARHLAALRLPRNHYASVPLRSNPSLRRSEGFTGQISWLSLTGSRVAYTRFASPPTDLTASDLWIQAPGGGPQLIDRIRTGESSSGNRSYLNPTIAGQWLYAYRQYTDVAGSDLVRYSLVRHAAEQAEPGFARGVVSALVYRSGAVWSLDTAAVDPARGDVVDTVVLLRPNLTWRAIPPAHPRAIGG